MSDRPETAEPVPGLRGPSVLRRVGVPLGVFIFALAVRLLYLAEVADSPFFSFRGVDALDYHQRAQAWLVGTWPGDEPFFWPPLYPLFLGALYQVLGQGVALLKSAHAVIGAASCVLVYLIGMRVFASRAVACVAAVICGACGPLVYFDGQLLSVGLEVFLQLAAILALLVAGSRRHLLWWATAGVCIGLSAVNRGGILLFLPIVLAWMWWTLRVEARGEPQAPDEPHHPGILQAAVALLFPIVLLMAPVVSHNQRTERLALQGETAEQTTPAALPAGWLPISANAGINFHLGNHWAKRHLNNTNHPRHFVYYDEVMDEPIRRGLLGPFQQSRFLVDRTLADIQAEPGDYAKLMALKSFQAVSGAEIPRNANLYADRPHSRVLSGLVWKWGIAFPTGLLIPLGGVGILASRREWRTHALLWGSLAAQFAVMLGFFVTARYRAPALPLIALYAAYTLHLAVGVVRMGLVRKGLSGGLMLAALLVLCNVRIGEMAGDRGYYEHCLLASQLAAQDRLDSAVSHYEEGLRLNPGYAWAHQHLGDVLVRQGRFAAASDRYRTALALEPDSPARPTVLLKLGRVRLMEGDFRRAAKRLRAALELRPGFAMAHSELGQALEGMGRLEEAVEEYSKAVRLRPKFGEARERLAGAQHRLRLEAANGPG
ncbi:MAG: tetratricopeptide repeat protein [bacterium]|nr:tetratricopeptide repeat protein [bacterium]